MRKRLYDFIKSPAGGKSKTTVYDYFMMIVIIVSLFPLTYKPDAEPYWIYYVEHVCITVFIIDYVLRWLVADYEYPHLRFPFLQYFYQPMAILDIVSILPGILVTITYHHPEFMTLMLLRLSRLARVLRSVKMLEYSHSCTVLRAVIKNSVRPLKAVVALTVSYIVIAALIIFHIEPGFADFFEALYWATVSLTIVGYGDLVPTTTLGRFVTMVSSLMGVAVVALPSGIVTAGYMRVLDEEEKVNEKMSKNEAGCPVDKAKGNADEYDRQ